MSPEIIKMIISVLLEYGPMAAHELVLLFSVQNPTIEDWKKVFSATGDKTYDDYIKSKPPTI
jgi:hypothetical protein